MNKHLDFLLSAFHEGYYMSTSSVLEWLRKQNEAIYTEIKQIPLVEMKMWNATENSIYHESRKFFSIDGINVKTNYGLVPSWEQPIINQPEIGFLGFVVQKKKGVLHFLAQAKIEPGNINVVQLSPTLQATRSNYTRVHKGKAPLYLDYFNGTKKVEILVDQLQSEQGARFLHKRNRNIIVEVEENVEIPIYENFVWLTLRQIKELMQIPNVINMDTRTVISCIWYGGYTENNLQLLSVFDMITGSQQAILSNYVYSILSKDNHLHSTYDIIKWITNRKFHYELSVTSQPLNELEHWDWDGNTITHKDNKYFSVIGVNVKIGNREVMEWDQPMVKAAQEGIAGFIIKKINGIYHFLVQGKLEPGNFDVIELAPTVQAITGNYRKGLNEYSVPYIEYFVDETLGKIWYKTYQSEEGGRFYHEQNLNMIVEVGDEFPIEVGENYCWMTLNQLLSFVAYNNYLNIFARSIISAIQFYKR